MPMGDIVYLNGAFTRRQDARISPLDRGFLFAHAAYEVTAVYGGRLVDFEGHVSRLRNTLDAIAIPNPHSAADWEDLHVQLLHRNGLQEGLIYLQVTAGAYDGRDFAGPDVFTPTVLLFADHRPLIGPVAEHGIRAIFLNDIRWRRRDIKTTQLLSQALAYRSAREAGAQTAFMVEDGYVTEAASANSWIVTEDDQIITRNLSSDILPGITRAHVIARLRDRGLTVEERAFTPDEAYAAREIFTTSAGAMIAPVVQLEDRPVGDGKPGPVTRLVQRLYYEALGADVSKVAAWALA
ncbi:MAG TPA: D-alanine aminotransferase [Hyphomonas atlantica]|nr:D-alanine aminotransferase [Hyphomonas atlantica]